MPQCQAKFQNSIQQADEEEAPTVVTYLGVVHAVSDNFRAKLSLLLQTHHRKQRSTTKILNHHDHNCTLRDLEDRGARHVLMALRHPLARISSSISQRLERQVLNKKANTLFVK